MKQVRLSSFFLLCMVLFSLVAPYREAMAKNEKEGEVKVKVKVKVKVRLLSKEEVKEYLELFLEICKCFVESKNGKELMTKEDKKIRDLFSYLGYLSYNGGDLGGLSKEKQKEIVGRVKDFAAVYFDLFSKKEKHQYLYGFLEEGLKWDEADLECLRGVITAMVLFPYALVTTLMPEDNICKEKMPQLDKLMSQCLDMINQKEVLSPEELSNILKQCKDAFPVSYNKSILKKLPA